MRIKIFKIGHNESSYEHTYGDSIFEPVLSSANPSSQFYCPLNGLISEFSSIRKVLSRKDLYDYDYLGLSHYRCLLGSAIDKSSYENSLISSGSEVVRELTEGGHNAILANSYKVVRDNRTTYPRWAGSEPIENTYQIMDSWMRDKYLSYLESDKNSYKVSCVIPRDEFIRIFSFITSKIPQLISLRFEHGTLYPRSVGYDLELLTSFMLVDEFYSDKYKLKTLPHNIL